MSRPHPRDARLYSRWKYALSLCETGYLFLVLFVFLASGLSSSLGSALERISSHRFVTAGLFLLCISLGYYCLSFPLTFGRSFLLERRFGLSKISPGDWLRDQLKSGIISYLLLLALVSAFYFLLDRYPRTWWVPVSIFWILFSFLLAQLAPVVIIPLFFKYKPLIDEALRERILSLAGRMQVKLLDVFQIDMSKKTLKANAAFTGWGPTRRVILGDTLKDRYTLDEIETVVAHEFAHYRQKHLLKLLAFHAALTAGLIYGIFLSAQTVLGWFGLHSLSASAALPAVFLYFHLFSTVIQPAHAFVSRRMERQADTLALRATGNPQAFISAMEKLGQQNLADTDPHPLIKFFFFDHPPISERIAMARKERPDE